MKRIRIWTVPLGAAFGFFLCWLGFTQYDTIVGALLLQDLYLWFVFVTAVITGGVGMWALRKMGARTLLTAEKVSWTQNPVCRNHLIGGAIFGAGWAISGTCPGPALAQIGSGQWAGIFTAIGIFGGIWLADRLEEPCSTQE